MAEQWNTLAIVDTNVSSVLNAALQEGGGILRLLPTWVHRGFCTPGRNLRLHPDDWYVLGAQLGTDERWFASTMPAKNTFKVTHEGLSFVVGPNKQRFLLADAVQEAGALLVGKDMWDAFHQWYVYAKFFDNKHALPLHAHMSDKDAAKAGLLGKPESYYFSPHYNQHWPAEPATYIGLRPGTTKDQIRRSLELWGREGDDIRYLSQAYLMRPGTGWLMPPGVLHAPAGLCTFEPQSWSDTFQMYQAKTSDGWLDKRELLYKDIPAMNVGDLDYMVELLDMQVNLDPDFARKYYLPPVLDQKRSGDGVTRKWVVYGTIGGQELFSATETTVDPGCEYTINEPGASGLLFVTGHGSIGRHVVETPTLLRYYDMTSDEFFVPASAADGSVRITNDSDEHELVFLQYYGPNTWGEEMPKAGA
jgi:hypothetical protein